MNFVNIKDKTLLITGGSSGLGYNAAVEFIRNGIKKVIICSRNEERGKKAKKNLEILAKKEKFEVVIQWNQIDLGSFKSIKEFATKINNDEEKLDYLILNGSALTPGERKVTEEGVEYMIGTLFVGHVYLLQLIDKLIKKNQSRIIFSCAEQKAINQEIPSIEEIFSKRENVPFMKAALAPKALMILWIKGYIQEMIKQKENVSFYIEVPPTMPTQAGTADQKTPFYFKMLLGVMKMFLFFQSKKKIAEPYLYLCSSSQKDLKNGGYYEQCKFIESIDYFQNDSNIEKVMKLTKTIFERIESEKQSKEEENQEK